MHKINKYFLSLIFICLSSPLHAMELFLPLIIIVAIQQIANKRNDISNPTFSISTSDNQVVRLSPKVMSHCLRLNAVLPLYKNISHKTLTVGCTEAEVTIFSQAIENPTHINYNQDLDLIMRMAEVFGAYTLYAHCISNYLNNIGSDFDTEHIVPLLKELTDTVDSEFILSKIVQLKNLLVMHGDSYDIKDTTCTQADHYLVNTKRFTHHTNSYHVDYHIKNKNQESLHKFNSYDFNSYGFYFYDFKNTNPPYLRNPYLFTTKPCVAYRKPSTRESREETLLYNFNNNTVLIHFDGSEKIYISKNEKLIAATTQQSCDIHNIDNIVDIRHKKIILDGEIKNLLFNSDGNYLVIVYSKEKQLHLMSWNMESWNWSNDDNIPLGTHLSSKKNYYNWVNVYQNNIFFVNKNKTKLNIINIINGENKGTFEGCRWENLPKNVIADENSENKTIKLYLSTAFSDDNPFPFTTLCSCSNDHIPLNNLRAYVDDYKKVTTIVKPDNNASSLPKISILHFVIQSIASNGWTTTITKNPNRTTLYNCKGKQIKVIENYYGLSIEGNCLFKNPENVILLYQQQDTEKCDALYENITCQQYALLDTFCSDDNKYRRDNNRSIQNDRLLVHMMKSFSQEHKNFIHEKLKITQ